MCRISALVPTSLPRSVAARAYAPFVREIEVECETLAQVEEAIAAGADIITFHREAVADPAPLIARIKDAGVRASMAISPATPADEVLPFLSMLDMVLVMTVVPGFGGQKLMPETLEKVRFLRRRAADIEVDGGISADNTALVTVAGANVIVAGSAIFGSPRPRQTILAMRAAAKDNPYCEE